MTRCALPPHFSFFFLKDTAPTEISPLPLPAALPISADRLLPGRRPRSPGRPGGRLGQRQVHRLPPHLRPLHPWEGTIRIDGQRLADIPRSALAADRKSTRLNSSHLVISYAVFCLKKK